MNTGNEEIIWEHPVQMIMASDEIRYVGKHIDAQCRHIIGRDEKFVTCEQIYVKLRPYAFPFEDELNFTTYVYMNLCACGTLYVGPSMKRTIRIRDAYGKGHHQYGIDEHYI